jgi:protein SCO1/2
VLELAHVRRLAFATILLAACGPSAAGFADITRGPAAAAGDTKTSTRLDLRDALQYSQRVIGKPVGEFTLTDREGRKLRLSDYRGKPLLVSFVYTGCSQVCPTTVKFLSQAVGEADKVLGTGKFNVVTIGFNLPFDTPGAMKQFAKKQGISFANWEFLSPDAAEVKALTRDLGFAYAASAGGFDHLTQVTILDPQGVVYRQVYGESFELPMLVAPLRDLLTDERTPVPDLAGLIEKVRLLCTVYDPLSGKYRLNYAVVIELFVGSSILFGGIAYLLREWRRNRRLRSA